MNCPKCDSAMWDNRGDKRNPKSPDFKCKNRQCGHAVWERPGRATGGAPPPIQSSGKWTWTQLSRLYQGSAQIAATLCKVGTGLDVQRIAGDIFAVAARDGIRTEAVAKPAPPPPPPPQDDEVPLPDESQVY